MTKDDLITAASSPASPASLLLELTTPTQDREVLLRLILNPNLPGAGLTTIFRQVGDLRLNQLASKHPNVLEEDLVFNAESLDERIRVNTAAHSRTPRSTLSRLSQDPSAAVRYETFFNAATPLEDRQLLSQDDDLYVRVAASSLSPKKKG